jgi:hypothetical protein
MVQQPPLLTLYFKLHSVNSAVYGGKKKYFARVHIYTLRRRWSNK